MKVVRIMLIYGLPWFMALTYGAISAGLDYQRFATERERQKLALEKLLTEVGELHDSIRRDLIVIADQFRNLDEEEGISDSISKTIARSSQTRSSISVLNAGYFPKSVADLQSSAVHLEEMETRISNLMEAKKKLLEALDELEKYPSYGRARGPNTGQTYWFWGMDLFTFLNMQNERAIEDAQRNRLVAKANALRSTVNLLAEEAHHSLEELADVHAKLNKHIKEEAEVTYKEVLLSRLREFSLGRKLREAFAKT